MRASQDSILHPPSWGGSWGFLGGFLVQGLSKACTIPLPNPLVQGFCANAFNNIQYSKSQPAISIATISAPSFFQT